MLHANTFTTRCPAEAPPAPAPVPGALDDPPGPAASLLALALRVK